MLRYTVKPYLQKQWQVSYKLQHLSGLLWEDCLYLLDCFCCCYRCLTETFCERKDIVFPLSLWFVPKLLLAGAANTPSLAYQLFSSLVCNVISFSLVWYTVLPWTTFFLLCCVLSRDKYHSVSWDWGAGAGRWCAYLQLLTLVSMYSRKVSPVMCSVECSYD